jgi:hypothetical protein
MLNIPPASFWTNTAAQGILMTEYRFFIQGLTP